MKDNHLGIWMPFARAVKEMKYFQQPQKFHLQGGFA